MRFNKIGQTILLALSLTAIIIAMSCSGADATKPEDLKIDASKELGSGRDRTPILTTFETNGVKSVIIDSQFVTNLMRNNAASNYVSTNGAGVVVTDITKVINSTDNSEIAGFTALKNDVGGVYRIDISDTSITSVEIEFSYKLKNASVSLITKTTPTKIGVNNDTTNWTSLDLTNQIGGSTENSLFGKTYVYGASSDISSSPTRFTNGLITNNILTVSIPANGMYKLWIY